MVTITPRIADVSLIEFVNPDGLAFSPGYTHVVIAQRKKTAYVSGQVATDQTGQVVGRGDLRLQTEQVYRNLQVALSAAGATFADVVKTTTFVVNLNTDTLSVIRQVRRQFLSSDHPPASTLIGVTALAIEGLLIEIDAIAAVD